MSHFFSKGGCFFDVRALKAKINGDDHWNPGSKSAAAVPIQIGGVSCGPGQYTVHITPQEALRLAAMLIEASQEAEKSELSPESDGSAFHRVQAS